MVLPRIPIVILIPARNDGKVIHKNLSSVAIQKYQNYRIIYVDDCSTDNTSMLVNQTAKVLGLTDRLYYLRTPQRNYQACSRFLAYHLCRDTDVICMLDGDDWLADDQVLLKVAMAYKRGAMATYGSYRCFSSGQAEKFIYGRGPAESFPPNILHQRSFRTYRWISQHLRTGYAGLFKRVALEDLLDGDNDFYRCCTDLAEMFPVLEMASPNIFQINSCLYIYNVDASKQSSYSYFRRQQNPGQNKYRELVSTRIRRLPKYPRVTLQQLHQHLEPTYQLVDPDCDEIATNNSPDFWVVGDSDQWPISEVTLMVSLLDACQLPLLLYQGEVSHPKFIYTKGIKMGFLSNIQHATKYIISNSVTHPNNPRNLESLLGKRCLVVDPSAFQELRKIFSEGMI
jgi:glycosyltransferase involved in cell wall biosynthesis